ncbi:hypothetical protein O181_039021 [Austropuccinia psidii MF-1]|uniref:Peroxin-19 n=1 Tax=Austropuccinia psidii MF-1 TaxID=1389203 RepID=A0A9Q3D8Z6_9BASI|nr:hypothetical protein [Austropuccinia psidii MF-1]
MGSNEPVSGEISIEDDMDDEFDDLLDKFQQPAVLQAKESTTKSKDTDDTPNNTTNLSHDISEEFARDLAEGMEALLASMKNEDGGEFKKHLESLVPSSENDNSCLDGLLDALGQNDDKSFQSTSTTAEPKIEITEFQEAIKDTMEKLKQSNDSSNAKNEFSAVGTEDEQLAELFAQMLGSEGALPDEGQLQSMLQSFMEELMSKEIMYEPLKDMNRLYPAWIAANQSKLSQEDIQRYQTQSEIVNEVVQKFEHPAWAAEEKAGGEKFAARHKEIVDLLTKMQDCGPPPKEILGDLPPGLLGENGLPNPEQCIPS